MPRTLILTAAFFCLFMAACGNKPLPSDLSLNDTERRIILNYGRLLLDKNDDRAAGLVFPERIKSLKPPLIITLFSDDGEMIATHRVDSPDLSIPEKLKSGIGYLRENHPIEPGTGYLHLMVVSYTARFANFGIKGLFDYKIFEPMVTGLAYELNGKRVEINPLQQLTLNKGAKSSRAYLAGQLGILPEEMPAYNDLVIEIYKVIHFGEAWPDRKFTNYFRGHRVFTMDEVSYETLMNRLKLIGQWYSNNVIDGEITYIYSPATGKYKNSERTMVRSTIATWIVNKLAYFLNDEKLKKLGEESLHFYLERYFNMSESVKKGVLIPSTKPTEIGEIAENRYTTAGFLVAAIIERGELEKYSKEVELLMNWAMAHQKPDGILWTQFAQSQYFDPGQFLLVVSFLYEKTGDKRHLEFFEKSFHAYASQFKDMMHLQDETYAPIAPAWFTQPFAKMHRLTGDKKYSDMVFLINDRVVKWYELNARYQVYYDYDGILAPKPGFFGNNSITAASLESLADAAAVAKREGDAARYKKYSEVIKRSTAYLMRLQFIPENTYYIPHRERVMGGFKTDLIDSTVWCDNVWHTTSAMLKIYKYELLNP
ncbi:MAG: hypothetical protein HYU99_01270 [Deltaproteobacteria bacterium]|nr:hypothetical protein [Deltaproteobacteria bacterium]